MCTIIIKSIIRRTGKDRFARAHARVEILLDLTRNELSKSSLTASFGKYFEIHYAKNKEQWAACFRKGTNMFVEAFHRVLKYVYMKGKVNKRMDKCIFVLLKLARDKGVNVSLNWKGKNTERINLIRKRH